MKLQLAEQIIFNEQGFQIEKKVAGGNFKVAGALSLISDDGSLVEYKKYPAQMLEVAGDLRRAPPKFENPEWVH